MTAVDVNAVEKVREHAAHCWQARAEPRLGGEHPPDQAAELAGGGKQWTDERAGGRDRGETLLDSMTIGGRCLHYRNPF